MLFSWINVFVLIIYCFHYILSPKFSGLKQEAFISEEFLKVRNPEATYLVFLAPYLL